MKEYYTWTKGDPRAQAMLDAINSHEKLPLTGTVKGSPAPDKQKTTKWAESLTEWTDGRVGFARIPEATLNMIGISQAERDLILSSYGPIIVDADGLTRIVTESE